MRVRPSVNVGINFPPRYFTSAISVARSPTHAPLGRKEGRKEASPSPSLAPRSHPLVKEGALLTQRVRGGHFCVGEGGRRLGVGGGTNTKSPSLPLSLPPSVVYPGESVFRSRLAYVLSGRVGGDRREGGGFAVAALGLNAKRRPYYDAPVGTVKNAASSIAIGRK